MNELRFCVLMCELPLNYLVLSILYIAYFSENSPKPMNGFSQDKNFADIHYDLLPNSKIILAI